MQAAQHFAREAYGDDRIDALHPILCESADDGVRVVLAADDGAIEVHLNEAMSGPLFSQCRAANAGPVRTYSLRAIST